MEPTVPIARPLLLAAALGLGTACDGATRPPPDTPEPTPPIPPEPALLVEGRKAYDAGDFERAVSLLEQAHTDLPDNRDVTFQLARAWVRTDRELEAEDLVGDLLLSDLATFRSRVQAEPAFDGDGFTHLLETGGVSSLPVDDVPRASFDLDGDGANETFAISYRTTRPERFLAIVAKTQKGAVAKRLATVTVSVHRVSAFRTGQNGAVVLLESAGGHSAEAEIHLVHGAAPNTALAYSKSFVLDAGDGDNPPLADGALWFSVIDLAQGGEPEIVLTFIDPLGEPGKTWVLDINGGSAKEMRDEKQLRKDAAQRLIAASPSPTRPFAEAIARLEPEDASARLRLLGAVDVPTQSEWWGFYPPGTNDYVALHSTFYARHTTPSAQTRLAQVPSVASFLAKWQLTPEQLASQTEPLLPPTSLWGRAHFLELVDVSTAFSYFRLTEAVPSSPGD